jgi:hypothetical protein
MPPASNRSLPFCETLEQEYCALTGQGPRPPIDIAFTPSQVLEPLALARRLMAGTDSVVTMLRRDLLQGLVADLVDPSAAEDRGQIRLIVAAAFNQLLDDPQFFDGARDRRFDGVRFRSQTADCIAGGPVAMRNRLILEDVFPELRKLFDLRATDSFRKLHEQQLRALCLSGGGIRSATFALGVIQGLARTGLLDQIDYLSTVSGGGYTGGWLSAWIARTSMPQVMAQLRQRTQRPLDPEPAPVHYLRRYSNYLTPRIGLLSADTWTLGATFVRNLLLNWLAFIPPLVALLSIPLVMTYVVNWQPVGTAVTVQYAIGLVLLAIAVCGSVAAVRYVHVNRPKQRGRTEGTGLFDEKRSQAEFIGQCLGPLVVAAACASICWAWGTSYSSPLGELFHRAPGWLLLGTLGSAIHLAGWLLSVLSLSASHRGAREVAGQGLLSVVSGFAIGSVASGLSLLAPPLWELTTAQRATYVWLAVPALLTVILAFSHLYVGYTSTKQSDAEREWSARFTGWVLIAVTVWFAGFGLIISGPIVIAWIGQAWSTERAAILAWILSIVAGFSGVGSAILAKGAKTAGIKAEPAAGHRSAIGLALASVFIAWLIILLSWLGGQAILLVQRAAGIDAPESTGALGIAIGVAAGLALFGWITGRLIDTNMFSLHAMYRARLIRAYLGASRPAGDRDPNRFTGFDDADNLHLRELWPQPAGKGGNQRPMHVINATLNLVAGDNLAWQERKAESFTFSPLHCGSVNVGYRPTQLDARDPSSSGYAGDLGASLGTALAISGAAASPDMGYHTSAVLSLILTFFNVRLGWWLGNPGHAGHSVYGRSSPASSLRPIVDEALGRTDDQNAYVYLSDGGHFDNLGLYEMVLRRNHVIVVSDASSDPSCGCEDLGNAIRKIRIDLGIPVDIVLPQAGSWTCAVGRIRYDCVDVGAPDGVLVYIKPALTGGEPADVLAYSRMNPAFPHESTADQWFTESQFESYRQLGSHIIESIAGGDPPADGATMNWFARQARRVAAR